MNLPVRLDPIFLVWLLSSLGMGCTHDDGGEIPESNQTFFSWVGGQEAPAFHLSFDWDSLMVHRESEESIDANFSVVTGDTDTVHISVKLATRGVNRKRICELPPLRLILDKDFLKKMGWSKPRKYKLVTECMWGQDDYLYREHLVYKLQSHLLTYHLKTLLIPIHYRMGDREHHGHVILIEDEDEMARRTDFELQDPEEKPIKLIHQEEYERLVLFQYLVGNTDWNLTRGHNIKWLTKSDGSVSPIPVAYDFDQCGLVNAPYAKPYPSLPITDVRERFLQYRGKDKTRLKAAADAVSLEREGTLKIILSESNLTRESQADLSRYLEEGFLSIEKEL